MKNYKNKTKQRKIVEVGRSIVGDLTEGREFEVEKRTMDYSRFEKF